MKPDNPSAFPIVEDLEHDSGYVMTVLERGMTLRDWFAGQALKGLLARKEFRLFTLGGDELAAELAAANAYELADAMLVRREMPRRGD